MNRVGTTAALCLLALGPGCGNSGSSSFASVPLNAVSSASTGLAQDDLVYVTNQNAEVTVYDLATKTLLNVLTRFTEPVGECVDASSDVYIADEGAKTIVEYAHGGKKPIKTFDDSPDSPLTCAIDPKTGNLAVADETDIAIWAQGSSKPTRYTDSALEYFVGCSYDTNGNLLAGSGSKFAWLPRGGSKLIDIVVPGPKSGWKWGVAGIQWDGQYFVLDSQLTAYRITVLHGLAYYVGATQLSGSSEIFYGPFWIYRPSSTSQSAQIVTPYCEERGCPLVESFDYPSGKGTMLRLQHGIDDAVAAVVSPKTE